MKLILYVLASILIWCLIAILLWSMVGRAHGVEAAPQDSVIGIIAKYSFKNSYGRTLYNVEYINAQGVPCVTTSHYESVSTTCAWERLK